MGWVPVAICILACLILLQHDRGLLLVLAALSTVGSFWSYGIMHNFAFFAASLRRRRKGGDQGITAEDAAAAPDWAALINFASAALSLGLLIYALVWPRWT